MLEKFIDAAIGNKKAETVLKNGSFVNVFTGEIVKADIAIEGGKIVGFGEYEGETEYDISGKIAVPGLIDAHVHIESSQLSPILPSAGSCLPNAVSILRPPQIRSL